VATPAENAKLVLAAYRHFKKHANEVLFPANFQSYVAEKGISVDDMKSGLVYGYEQKWFEDGPNGTIKVTVEGYNQMPQA